MTKADPASSKLFNLLGIVIRTLSVISVSYGIVTAVAFSAQNGVRDSFVEVDSIKMLSVQNLHALGRAMMIIDSAENALLATDIGEKKRQSIYSQFDAAKRSLTESLKAYEILPRSPEEARTWEDFVRALEMWNIDHERFVQLARKNEKSGTPETYKDMSAQALEVNPASLAVAMSLLDAAIETSLGGTEKKSNITTNTGTSSYQKYTVGALVLGASIAALAMIVLLIKRARCQHRRFRLGKHRLILDVDRFGKVFSSANSAKNKNEKS